ncbi:protein MODIFYING WALL LIGNIN-2-like [Arachis duranensis]|uniref:Transmembrane protein n=2 Tax=Arachis TaxID=3817 RepID=A0A444WUZ6_ARAHY|nr:protein MODIFYING WALL LIGNIN-2-like [Arachis duranensis]XP_025651592.1 uncharacterized protein LOC112747656 [Arachis hypogaea]XP_025698241.1 uncharacterized protein LOC112800266 [Arachis hypogaea]XP_057759487.1 protein MODIFYING WALL LIGNIN-2-like [Arachis stenosperma]QHO40293.1 uncharacterized protein DS421_5g136310 [Arachis hypogaea]RYQ81219.1 hypothetical protein Ahy_Scaffold1g107202 [Arachis hypogaea]
METPNRCKFTVIFSVIISLTLALVSCLLCIASEIKRNKKEDLRFNGKQCYLPSSQAFGLGIAALVCLSLAQIIGNCVLFKNYCSGGKRNSHYKITLIAMVLLLISWLSFGIAMILLITATSMSKRQPYRIGWLNGECYLVKRGVYAGSTILILVTVGSVIGSVLLTIKANQTEQDRKIHAQTG